MSSKDAESLLNAMLESHHQGNLSLLGVSLSFDEPTAFSHPSLPAVLCGNPVSQAEFITSMNREKRLQLAIEASDEEFLQQTSYFLEDYNKMVIVACLSNHASVVEHLMKEKGINPNLESNTLTPLCAACSSGSLEVVKALLSLPAVNVNMTGSQRSSPLHGAVASGYMVIVETLLAHPELTLDPFDSDNRTPFMLACELKFDDIAERLADLVEVEETYFSSLELPYLRTVKWMMASGMVLQEFVAHSLQFFEHVFEEINQQDSFFRDHLADFQEAQRIVREFSLHPEEVVRRFRIELGFSGTHSCGINWFALWTSHRTCFFFFSSFFLLSFHSKTSKRGFCAGGLPVRQPPPFAGDSRALGRDGSHAAVFSPGPEAADGNPDASLQPRQRFEQGHRSHQVL